VLDGRPRYLLLDEVTSALDPEMTAEVLAILAKLEVSSQLAAVGLAHQVGWRPPAL